MIKVPENTIAIVTEHPTFDKYVDQILHPLKNERKRDWFIDHCYFCLPLVIGNQYGIAIRSLFDFTVEWDGGLKKESTIIEFPNSQFHSDGQFIKSHFGMGTVTIQNRFHFRTPSGVNLMTINPPNYYIDGIHYMTGVIETDNLRRDFTFNIKITRPNHKIYIKRGDFIGCILPVPRYFVDSFDPVMGRDLFTEKELDEERKTAVEHGRLRKEEDVNKPRRNGRLYFKGVDAWGNKFDDHQKTIKRNEI